MAKAKKTNKKTTKQTKKQKQSKTSGKTEFGSNVSSQAGKIDVVLIKNKNKEPSISDIAKQANLSEARVRSHVKHLISKRDIPLQVSKDGVVTFK